METNPARTNRWAWAALAVPLAAVVELVAQQVIQARVPTPAQWRAAAAYLRTAKQPGDLVTSAPLWTDPLARQYFADVIPLADSARPDATRYRRALVATIRGGENPDLRGALGEVGRQRPGSVRDHEALIAGAAIEAVVACGPDTPVAFHDAPRG